MPKSFYIFITLISFIFINGTSLHATGWSQYTYNNDKYVSLQNVKSFYRFSQMTQSGSKVTLQNSAVRLQFSLNSHECLINNVKFILSKPITLLNGKRLLAETDLEKLIDPILRPINNHGANIFNTVIIDAGHGGKDPGAVNSYGTEAGYNLIVAKKVQYLLKNQGLNVIMTRSGNTFLSLTERVHFANKYTNAIFISIHFNAEGKKQAAGIETFTLSPQGVPHYGRNLKSSDHKKLTGNRQDSQNIALATAVHGSALLRVKRFDRGIRRARYSVLTGIKHPAILVEGGFLSHPTESRIIHTTIYQNSISKGIAEGILKYRAAMQNSLRR